MVFAKNEIYFLHAKNKYAGQHNFKISQNYVGLMKLREDEVVEVLRSLRNSDDLKSIKEEASSIVVELREKKKYEALVEILEKVVNSYSLERAKYYITSAIKYLTEVKTNGINDINLNRWREYRDVLTDSLWIFPNRDRGNGHSAWYWGNFVPQIPRQLMYRYTKKYEWVLDPFCGSGTTLIEALHLGRNCIGIELSEEIAKKSMEVVQKIDNKFGVRAEIIVGDSVEMDFGEIAEKFGIDGFKLAILHPPYHDIINFTDDPRDLSNSPTIEVFLDKLEKVVEKTYRVLKSPGYMAMVIGDKYENSEWIPLGFYAMQRAMKIGYRLKSIVVKNFELGRTRGKRFQKELWRYRALVGGFYIFRHEYIFIFEKR